jgi:hypothetical protein
MTKLRFLIAFVFTGLLISCSDSGGGGPTFNSSSSSSSSSSTSTSSTSSSGGPVSGVLYDNTLPLTVDFSVGRDEFFGGQLQNGDPAAVFPALTVDDANPAYETVGTFLAISDDADNPFYKITGSAERITINEQNNMFFGNAFWVAGNVSRTATSSTAGGFVPPDGDIDLSAAYSITIEIESVPTFTATTGTNGFQVLVDNNTSGSANSIHGGASRFMNLQVDDGLAVGTMVINVPGDITMTPTGGAAAVVGNVPVHRGTANSFLGFRCPSECGDPPADGIVISSIVVAYQENGVPPAPPSAPALIAGEEQIEVSWFPVGGATGYDVAYNTIDDTAGAIVIEDIAGTSTTITGLANGTPYFVFVSSQNAEGNSAYSASSSATPAAGPPDAPAAPDLTAGAEQISVSWAAVTGATTYDVAYNTVNDTAGATVLADFVGTNTTISGLTGATEYFVFVLAKNLAGESGYGPGASATPTAAVAGPWAGEGLDLYNNAVGSSNAPSGAVLVNTATAVTISATGGRSSQNDDFRIFFANQQLTWPFTFTARVVSVSVTGGGDPTVFNNNAFRYGLLILENKDPIPHTGAIATLTRFASMEYYTDGNAVDPFLQGSRVQKLDIAAGSRSRSNVDVIDTTPVSIGGTGLSPGHYLRIEVTDDGGVPRVIRYTSPDNITYTQANSSLFTDSGANGYPTSFYVGFYGDPGEDDLTVEFDNIEIIQP